MNVPSEIKELFKSLATAHPDILHEDVEGKIAFYVDQLSDILEGVFKSGLKPEGISFRFVSPMFQPISDETHGILVTVQTGFAILKKCDPTILAEIEAAKDITYRIVKDIIVRLVHESRMRNSILGGSLNHLSEGQFSIEETLFQGDGSWAGYLCLMQFRTEYIDCIETAVQAAQWTDL